jgi:DNA topoisomerase 2-associated protein PAT1
MAFFGLEQNDMLERDKQRFLQQQQHGGGNGGHSGNSGSPGGPSDMAVYTWGEDGYDGLGDALQERGDDFNDETFGTSGPVGESI